MRWKERFVVWGSVVLYCGLLSYLSAQSDLTLPDIVQGSDKIAHLLAYAGLGWLSAHGWRREYPGWQLSTVILFASTFAAAYGASDEWRQAYVPGRNPDWQDWLADLCGGTLGGTGYILWIQLKGILVRRLAL